MGLATWWYEDGIPAVGQVDGFTVEVPQVDDELAAAASLTVAEVARRRKEGHRPYLGRLDGVGVAYGWVATESAEIGELGISFRLPAGHRYLWDFATLPAWRGRGFYPRLLADIVRRESPPATRLWIIHAPENHSSAHGIARAGFRLAAELSLTGEGDPALRSAGDNHRAAEAAHILDLPLIELALSPCWHCGPAGRCLCGDGPGCGCGAGATRSNPASR